MEPILTDLHLTVNGEKFRRRADGEETLLHFLRTSLGLTGAKNGCGTGQCGACTVLLNGKTVRSCTLRLKSPRLIGAQIITIEGLSGPGGALHPIQQAFIDAGAVQCGFCTPGMILSAKALLDQNPRPDREAIRSHFDSRNLCRCTGYEKIFQAVEDAARALRGEPRLFAGSADDASMTREAAAPKVRGELRYADDITPAGTLHGAVLYPEEPHAILTSLDISAAQTLPGVAGIITAADFAGTGRFGLVDRDQLAMVAEGGEIRSVADPLCAVFADTPEQAARARDAVAVRYEVLPGVYTLEEALKKGAPLVRPEKPDNIFYDRQLVRGEAATGLKTSDIVVGGRFSTSRIAHGYMEPETGLAFPDGRGGVDIHYPSQTVFDDRIQIAEALGLAKEAVRVRQLPTGGAFGGKEDVVFQPILARAALKFGRPVKITLSRPESLKVVQKKHPVRFEVSLGLDRDGRFRALDADILTDKGACASLGFDIIENMMAFIGGCYYIPQLRVRGRSVHTHNVMSGAMRGFGANQSNFVIESLVDMAARETGLDPVEIRMRNALRPGLPTITGHVLEPGVPAVVEVLDACRKAVAAVAAGEAPGAPEGWRTGFGMACGVKNIGFGHHLPESAGARVALGTDGRCRISVTHHEYGQGAAIGEARIASEVLGIPVERISVDMPDTAITPFTGASTASRQTFLSGNAVRGACEALLSKLLSRAAGVLGLDDPACLAVSGDSVVVRGGPGSVALVELGDCLEADFRSIAPETEGFPEGDTGLFGSPGFRSSRTHWAYAYGAQAAWAAVNPSTGEVKVLKVVTVSDVGRVLNRRAVEGQQEGGVMMGIGYALSEQFQVENGRNLTRDLRGCGIPRAGAAPEIVSLTVEVPHPGGPLGAKGFAEAPSLATAPAVANAIFDAVGVRMRDLPITPERLKGAMDEPDRT